MEKKRPSWVDRVIVPSVLGIPSYVPGKPVAELKRELGVPHAFKMASNENPLGPSPLAMKAVRDHLSAAHVYPESSAPELRCALAARFGTAPDEVILGNGSDEIMQMVAHVFIRPDTEAVTIESTFSMYRICVESFGGRMVHVPFNGSRYDLAAISRAVTERTRLVFLTIPNNPTGTIVSRSEFDSFVSELPGNGLILVLDEAYREYVETADCPSGVDYLGRDIPVLVLRTFSKIYGLAGLRVGYGFGQSWLIELLNRVRPPFNVNSLAQVAAMAALEDSEHVERSLRLTREGKAFLSAELTALGLTVIPSEANFLSFCLEGNAKPVYEAMLREGIIVRHLASFGMENCIRVTVGTEEQNNCFLRALRRVLGRCA